MDMVTSALGHSLPRVLRAGDVYTKPGEVCVSGIRWASWLSIRCGGVCFAQGCQWLGDLQVHLGVQTGSCRGAGEKGPEARCHVREATGEPTGESECSAGPERQIRIWKITVVAAQSTLKTLPFSAKRSGPHL